MTTCWVQGDEWVGMFADSAFSRQQFRRRQRTIGFRTARRTRAPRRSTSWTMALPIPRLAPIAVFKFAELAGEGAGPKLFFAQVLLGHLHLEPKKSERLHDYPS
jgi:hypothetical protein